jgi:hypothetical protein
VVISSVYLWRIRPAVAAAEEGRVPERRQPKRSAGGGP